MSEQEKKEAIVTEGTVTEKKSLFQRIKQSPKTKKVLIGFVEFLGIGTLCLASFKAGTRHAATAVEGAVDVTDDDDDAE